MMTSDTGTSRAHDRAPIQMASAGVGGLLIALGVVGFVPGITNPYAALDFAGMSSTAEILGIFQVSGLLNMIHLASGVVGLVCQRRPLWSRNFLLWCGIFYVALFLFGLLVQLQNSDANFIPVNSSDNFLHLVIGFGMIAASIFASPGPEWRATIQNTEAGV